MPIVDSALPLALNVAESDDSTYECAGARGGCFGAERAHQPRQSLIWVWRRSAQKASPSACNDSPDHASTISPLSINLSTAITQQQIWIAAIALIGLDLLFPVIPIMPLVAIYVLIAQPTWFKEFVDYVYRR
jgi:hypothetical protein